MHEVLLLGKIKDTFIAAGVDEYLGRLKHYTKAELRYLKPKGKRGNILSTEQEGQLLLESASPDYIKVVLDVQGKMLSSEELAEQITKFENSGAKGVSYLIGGPLGHSQEVLKAADIKLSFSRMTFTHDMIRLLLIEQLYRAYTIKAGEKYHK